MQLVARIAVALAVLALATPALACGGDKMKSADKAEAKPAVASATGEKAQPAAASKAKAAAVKKAEPKPVAVQN